MISNIPQKKQFSNCRNNLSYFLIIITDNYTMSIRASSQLNKYPELTHQQHKNKVQSSNSQKFLAKKNSLKVIQAPKLLKTHQSKKIPTEANQYNFNNPYKPNYLKEENLQSTAQLASPSEDHFPSVDQTGHKQIYHGITKKLPGKNSKNGLNDSSEPQLKGTNNKNKNQYRKYYFTEKTSSELRPYNLSSQVSIKRMPQKAQIKSSLDRLSNKNLTCKLSLGIQTKKKQQNHIYSQNSIPQQYCTEKIRASETKQIQSIDRNGKNQAILHLQQLRNHYYNKDVITSQKPTNDEKNDIKGMQPKQKSKKVYSQKDMNLFRISCKSKKQLFQDKSSDQNQEDNEQKVGQFRQKSEGRIHEEYISRQNLLSKGKKEVSNIVKEIRNNSKKPYLIARKHQTLEIRQRKLEEMSQIPEHKKIHHHLNTVDQQEKYQKILKQNQQKTSSSPTNNDQYQIQEEQNCKNLDISEIEQASSNVSISISENPFQGDSEKKATISSNFKEICEQSISNLSLIPKNQNNQSISIIRDNDSKMNQSSFLGKSEKIMMSKINSGRQTHNLGIQPNELKKLFQMKNGNKKKVLEIEKIRKKFPVDFFQNN